MPDSAFRQPVPLFSPNPDGTVRRVELATVQEGFRALNHGLGGFCLDHPEWHLAFHSLSQAMLDPAPDRIEAAREALLPNLSHATPAERCQVQARLNTSLER